MRVNGLFGVTESWMLDHLRGGYTQTGMGSIEVTLAGNGLGIRKFERLPE
ncbi:MAG: hypothetical protein K6U00_05730 [Armatimonadetes bacterium]|nr:hypothetical protein [Armatimonadota bacterium]